MTEVAPLPEYDALLREVRGLLETSRNRAYQAVDNIRVQAYWQVGERIVRAELEHKERADYGARVVERLARDLRMARRLLFEIVQFYRTYPLVHSLRTEISWSQYGILMRVGDARARAFYEGQAARNGWSVRELEEQVRSDLYERSARDGVMAAPAVPTGLMAEAAHPEDAFRSIYHFEVPGLPAAFSEDDLERALLSHLEDKRDHFAAIRPTIGMDAWRCTSSRGRMSECMRSTGAHASASPTIRSPVRLSHNLPRSVKGRTPSSTMATTSTTSLRRARQRPFQRSLRPTNKTLLTMSTGCTIAQRNGDQGTSGTGAPRST